MKVIRVQYTVKENFADQNQQNINAVMAELREENNQNIHYAAYRFEDGKTFMHLVHYNSSGVEHLPASLDSFKHFQKELKENVEIPPKVEDLGLVDSSSNIF